MLGIRPASSGGRRRHSPGRCSVQGDWSRRGAPSRFDRRSVARLVRSAVIAGAGFLLPSIGQPTHTIPSCETTAVERTGEAAEGAYNRFESCSSCSHRRQRALTPRRCCRFHSRHEPGPSRRALVQRSWCRTAAPLRVSHCYSSPRIHLGWFECPRRCRGTYRPKRCPVRPFPRRSTRAQHTRLRARHARAPARAPPPTAQHFEVGLSTHGEHSSPRGSSCA